jgi:succinoglycan biosynthesis protein ExoH
VGTALSERIRILRCVLIFGIVVLHIPPYVPLAEVGPGVFDFIKAMMQHAVFRASVPVLAFISGYLLFSQGLDRRFSELAFKKTRSLLVPLIAFNLPLAVAIWLAQVQGSLNQELSPRLHPVELQEWADGLLGLFGPPVNYPLNFLRDLFVLSMLAPIFGVLLRRAPWAGLCAVFCTFWFDLDGPIVLRGPMAVTFYLGGMAAAGNWDMHRLDRFAWPFLALFLLLCAAVVLLEIEDRRYLRLLSPILLWPSASLLVGTAAGRLLVALSRYSFFTFLTHAPILFALWLVYQMSEGPYWVFWISAPAITGLIAALVFDLSCRWMPKTMSLLTGGRAGRSSDLTRNADLASA